MNRATRTLRLLSGATALSIGLLGAVAMATPVSASARHTVSVHGEAVCDTTSGTWVITWTVMNDQPDQVGTIRSVSVTPDADISPITLGAKLPGSDDGSLTATQHVVPGAAAEATLTITVIWGRTAPPSHADATVELSGDCAVPSSPSPEPPASPSPPAASPSPEPSPELEDRGLAEATFDCDVFSLVINNALDKVRTVFVVPSQGETVEVTVPAGESSGAIEFPSSAGLTVDVRLEAGGESALDGGAFEIDADEFAANCDDDGQGGGLPTTGMSTWLIAGGAVALLALGAGLFLIARRRRVTFTA